MELIIGLGSTLMNALVSVAPTAVKMYSPRYGSRALRKSDSYSVSGSTRKW